MMMDIRPTSLSKRKKRKVQKKKRQSDCSVPSVTTSYDLSVSFKAGDDYQKSVERECLVGLAESCDKAGIRMSAGLIFRFACFYSFDYHLAWKAIKKKHNDRHLKLRMEGKLLKQFESLTCFPLPSLMTKNRQEVFYMRCCRHFPGKTDTSVLIDNIAYIMNEMSRTEEQCRNGIAFIIDMENWTVKNMSNECSSKFMLAGQGDPVPTKVELMLIINSPKIFKPTWKVFKHMMPKSFAKKIHFVKDWNALHNYFVGDFDRYLPFELNGWRCASELVEDYIDLQRHAEAERYRQTMLAPRSVQ
jgi:hypothetical protein